MYILLQGGETMKIKINFHAEYADYFEKSTEFEITEPVIKVIELIEILLKKYGDDKRSHFLSKDGELQLVMMSKDGMLKLFDEIKKDLTIEVFPILVGG